MAKKCPPGVFCIENYTLGILMLIIAGFLFYLWNVFHEPLSLELRKPTLKWN